MQCLGRSIVLLVYTELMSYRDQRYITKYKAYFRFSLLCVVFGRQQKYIAVDVEGEGDADVGDDALAIVEEDAIEVCFVFFC